MTFIVDENDVDMSPMSRVEECRKENSNSWVRQVWRGEEWKCLAEFGGRRCFGRRAETALSSNSSWPTSRSSLLSVELNLLSPNSSWAASILFA